MADVGWRVTRRGLGASAALGALAALAVVVGGRAAAQERPVLVFAAASLKTALDAIAARWRTETGQRAVMSYAASPALARQIEGGAPADLFIAADQDWMDYLAQRRLIHAESRRDLLGNRLVLIAPRRATQAVTIAPGFPLRDLLGDGRLAIGHVASVPGGKYGKAALQALGVWPSVADRLAQAENTRAALLLVARGEAPLGVVYRSDAIAEPAVRVLDTFPESSHPAIVYPLALLAGSRHPQAATFAAYLRSEGGRAVFVAQGFTVVE